MDWSAQQSTALEGIRAWLKGGKKTPQILRVFGYAGTGKTTIAKEVQEMAKRVIYATFTWKAALVLRSKGCADAQTLHSLIYKVDELHRGQPTFSLNGASDLKDADVLCVDEVSMVDEEIGRDVESFGKKILVLGDPFQLPPLRGMGYFTEQAPDFMLTEIHRQAADNPIIRMSMDIREGKILEYGNYGESRVIPRSRVGQRMVTEADQVLCGLNATRRDLNRRIRNLKWFADTFPMTGDKLVCLRNNREKGLLNGSLWKVIDSSQHGKIIKMTVEPDGGGTYKDVEVREEFFLGTEKSLQWYDRRKTDEFDFGYGLTVHKAQGSQWQNVLLFDESASFRENAQRHLYTAVTRAAQRITVIV
jgi:exodeoxyribonuclease-5